MLFVYLFLLICINVYFISKTHFETFITNYNAKLFLLQSKNLNVTLQTIDILNIKVGYTYDYEKRLFVYLYNQHNCIKIRINDVHFVRVKSISFSNADILIYSGEFVPQTYDVRIIDYFKDTINHPSYDFVVYNHTNMTYMVLGLWKTKHIKNDMNKIQQTIKYHPKYNFVIENNINGKYHEKDINTNEIVLYQNKLDNLEVKVGDTMLFRNQKENFINGVYKVHKVNKYIYLIQHVKVLPKYYVCIDESLTERPEYNNKYSCEYHKDMNGNDKKLSMKWDSRCRRNLECPLFDEDDNYSGRCKNGYCEMPSGYQSVSFTQYKKSDMC